MKFKWNIFDSFPFLKSNILLVDRGHLFKSELRNKISCVNLDKVVLADCNAFLSAFWKHYKQVRSPHNINTNDYSLILGWLYLGILQPIRFFLLSKLSYGNLLLFGPCPMCLYWKKAGVGPLPLCSHHSSSYGGHGERLHLLDWCVGGWKEGGAILQFWLKLG